MKKLLIVILAVLPLAINAQSDPNLKWLHPKPQGQDLQWIKLWDENNWYAVGNFGMFMKTTDAGQTWEINNSAGWPQATYPNLLTNWDAYEAWFFDQNNGIVVGRNAQGILRTTDGGETFDTMAILPTGQANMRGIYFVNSNLGFICGSSTFGIYKTTNGGNNWSQLPNLAAVTYYDVFATSELDITTCSDGGKIYKTTDGGTIWNEIQLGTAQPLYDLEFINATTGFVCGGIGFFKATTDGGLTWTSGVNTTTSQTNWKIKYLSGDLFVSGDYDELFKSTDNGLSWISFTLPDAGLYPGFNYCMDKVGSSIVAAGQWGNIYKSTDSGSSWSNLLHRFGNTNGSTFGFISVIEPEGKIIATTRLSGFPGSIIYSNDGGDTWQSSPFSSGNLLNELQMFDDNNGYFVGDAAFIGKTTDGGINLTNVAPSFAAGKNIIDLDFHDQLIGWIAGGSPAPGGTVIIAKTTDSGTTWIDQSIPTLGGRIKGIDMVDNNIGYFSHATIWKTTNGGTSWTQQPIAGVDFFEDVYAFDANNVYAVGSAGGTGAFYKTTDGGTNWSQVTTPTFGTAIFYHQDWLDMNDGIITGTFGLILKTTDGGATWTMMNTGGHNVTDCQMISPGLFFVTGREGQVFKYDDGSSITTFQLTVDISNGWNMVSIPGLNTPDQNVNTWWSFRDPGANVFKYLGGYQSVTDAVPGTGYWMKHAGARTYNTGDEWPAGGIQVVVHDPLSGASGWNLIGGYELSVSASGVTTNPPGLQSGPIYKYSGGYQTATTIDPGYGYWIKLSAAGQIIIPEVLSKGKESSEYFPEEWGKIILTDAKGIRYTLYAVKGETDLTQYELPPTPMAGVFDIRYSNGRIAEDLSNPQSIEMNSVSYPVKVRVENMKIRIQYEEGKDKASLLKPGEEFTISDNTIDKLRVLSGELITPEEYTLEQNYPNPFNPSTTIKFTLPEASDVTLSIYNTLGQKVTELVNGKLEAGKYSYQWNASEVATGMYIYELRADPSTSSGQGFVSVKKMILLK